MLCENPQTHTTPPSLLSAFSTPPTQTEEIHSLIMPHVTLAYASSGRSMCRSCFVKIPKGDLRYTWHNSQKSRHYHAKCFFDKIPVVLPECPSMETHGKLAFKTPKDQKVIEDLIKEAAKTWKKRFGREIAYPTELALLKSNKLTDSQLDHQMSEEVVCGISSDVWVQILLFMQPQHIVKVSRVSMGMYFIVNDDRLWEALLTRSYPADQVDVATKSLHEQGSNRAKFVFQKLFAELCVCCSKGASDMQYLKPVKRSICRVCLQTQSNSVNRWGLARRHPYFQINDDFSEYALLSKKNARLWFHVTDSQLKRIPAVKAPFQKNKDTNQYLYGYTKRYVERMRSEEVLEELSRYNLVRPVTMASLEKGEEEEKPLLEYISGDRPVLRDAVIEYTQTWSVGEQPKEKTKKRKRVRDGTKSPSKKKTKATPE
mmetsp:Transcript_2202/g.8075  ORF Transcript_2202/g.8075 Transcript_2202/m.8075 type:complete len:429 (+) Transcript_2202:2-1288(+)